MAPAYANKITEASYASVFDDCSDGHENFDSPEITPLIKVEWTLEVSGIPRKGSITTLLKRKTQK
jgi:hypothetical protein